MWSDIAENLGNFVDLDSLFGWIKETDHLRSA